MARKQTRRRHMDLKLRAPALPAGFAPAMMPAEELYESYRTLGAAILRPADEATFYRFMVSEIEIRRRNPSGSLGRYEKWLESRA